MYKVALVGLGGISNTHLPVWKELDDCELVAVCDTRPEQMDAYPDARHYTDFYEMLEKEKLDILVRSSLSVPYVLPFPVRGGGGCL